MARRAPGQQPSEGNAGQTPRSTSPDQQTLPKGDSSGASTAPGNKPVLLRGPYTSPNVRVGDAVTCAIRGCVEVKGWHDKGAIAIPLGGVKGTRWSMVVSDDLLKALYVETSVAICFYWNVSELSVATWRRHLGIDGRATESFIHAMRQAGLANGRADGVAERLRGMNARPWTPKELALLPKFSNAEVTALTNRSREAVENARARYRLPQRRNDLTCGVCGYTWLPQNNHVPRRCPKHACRQPLLQEGACIKQA